MQDKKIYAIDKVSDFRNESTYTKVINGYGIDEWGYLEFLDYYLKENACTPSGIGDKYFFDDLGESEGVNRYQLCHWSNGSKIRGNIFKETLEECQDWLYQIAENNMEFSSMEYPDFFESVEQAESYIMNEIADLEETV
jgi:hypothetical protein